MKRLLLATALPHIPGPWTALYLSTGAQPYSMGRKPW
jgi:hypothetical protein